jgi:hypothetical protein
VQQQFIIPLPPPAGFCVLLAADSMSSGSAALSALLLEQTDGQVHFELPQDFVSLSGAYVPVDRLLTSDGATLVRKWKSVLLTTILPPLLTSAGFHDASSIASVQQLLQHAALPLYTVQHTGMEETATPTRFVSRRQPVLTSFFEQVCVAVHARTVSTFTFVFDPRPLLQRLNLQLATDPSSSAIDPSIIPSSRRRQHGPASDRPIAPADDAVRPSGRQPMAPLLPSSRRRQHGPASDRPIAPADDAVRPSRRTSRDLPSRGIRCRQSRNSLSHDRPVPDVIVLSTRDPPASIASLVLHVGQSPIVEDTP